MCVCVCVCVFEFWSSIMYVSFLNWAFYFSICLITHSPYEWIAKGFGDPQKLSFKQENPNMILLEDLKIIGKEGKDMV